MMNDSTQAITNLLRSNTTAGALVGAASAPDGIEGALGRVVAHFLMARSDADLLIATGLSPNALLRIRLRLLNNDERNRAMATL